MLRSTTSVLRRKAFGSQEWRRKSSAPTVACQRRHDSPPNATSAPSPPPQQLLLLVPFSLVQQQQRQGGVRMLLPSRKPETRTGAIQRTHCGCASGVSGGRDNYIETRRQHQKPPPRRQELSSASFSTRAGHSDGSGGAKTTTTTALVIGSSGALGSAVSRYLASLDGTKVLGADVVEVPPDLTLDGFELDGFVHLPRHSGLTELTTALAAGVHRFLETAATRRRLDAIVCASGGWKMDPTPSEHTDDRADLERSVREYTESIQQMLNMNLDPVVAAAFVAQHFMNPNGLLVVMGASAALQPTPGMLAYGISKCASHHVVRTLGASTGLSLESKAVRQAGARARQTAPSMDNLTCIGILPTMIDTPANRKLNQTADNAKLTKPCDIAMEIGTWITKPDLRPHSGSLLKVHPDANGMASFELVR